MLRTYLAAAWGVEWYSVYKGDGLLFDEGTYIADWDSIKIIKDHTFREEYRNVIFVVRDGRDVVLSLAYYSYLNGEHRYSRQNDLFRFINLLKNGYAYGFWGDYIRRAIDLAQDPGRNVLFVKYEDIIMDPLNNLNTIAGFLNKKVERKILQEAIQKVSEDKRYQTWKGWGFTDEPDEESIFYKLHKNRGGSNWKGLFDEAAKAAFHNNGGTEMLMHFGYETDPFWWIK